jgi:heavy metal translocating P-type ATPase
MNPCQVKVIKALPGRIRVRINGLTGSPLFAKSLEKTLKRNEGIFHVKANSQTGKALIIFDGTRLTNYDLLQLVSKNISYIFQLVSSTQFESYKKKQLSKSKDLKKDIFKPEDLPIRFQVSQVIFSGVILAAITLMRLFSKNLFLRSTFKIHIITTITTLITGYAIFRSGLESLIKEKKLNNDSLISSATIISIVLKEGVTGQVVVWLVNLSALFQTLTIDKSRKAIKDLLQGKEETIWVEIDGTVISIPIEKLEMGSIIVTHLGEKIQADGEIVDGVAEVNQSVITGESMPVLKTIGDKVYAGSIIEQGTLKIKAEKIRDDTVKARIIHLVEEASSTRAPIQNIADRYSEKIIPLSFGLAAFIYLFTKDFKRSMTMLIVACPCAAGLATPTAFSAAMGNAATKGILIKGGSYLENISHTDVILFDKTGTLTEGRPIVTDIKLVNKSFTKESLLQLAASLEAQTQHPLARAITSKAEEMNLELMGVDNKEIKIGYGIKGHINGQEALIGNEVLMEEYKISIQRYKQSAFRLRVQGKTVLYLSYNGKLVGLIAISDKIRDKSKLAIKKLRQSGIETIGLITGDSKETAELVGNELGIDSIWFNTLPEGKVDVVKKYQEQGQRVIMVGEGINDTPALAKSDIGIAMGTGGTDVAIESADVVLAGDDPLKIYSLIAMSNKTMEVIKQNFIFAVGINAIGLLLGAGKFISPLLAAILHNLSTFGVVVNSSRLLFYDNGSGKKKGSKPIGRYKRTSR